MEALPIVRWMWIKVHWIEKYYFIRNWIAIFFCENKNISYNPNSILNNDIQNDKFSEDDTIAKMYENVSNNVLYPVVRGGQHHNL